MVWEDGEVLTLTSYPIERIGLDEQSLPAALNRLNRTQAWLEECLQREARYGKTCAALLSDQARARTLGAMRLPLTRFKIQNLTLSSLEAAQEAVLCLTNDGLSPEQVAQECGAVWDEQELFLADLPRDVQQQFLSAAAGEVLPPKSCDTGFFITRVMTKFEPSLDSDMVRERIDRQLLGAHFSELSIKRIRWVLGGPSRS